LCNKRKYEEIGPTSIRKAYGVLGHTSLHKSCTVDERKYEEIGPTSIRKSYGGPGHTSLHKSCTMDENQRSSSHLVPKEGI
jgi:hypothetical protein